MKIKYVIVAFLVILIAGMVIPAIELVATPKKGRMTYAAAIRQLTFAVMTYKENYKVMPSTLNEVISEYEDQMISPERWTPDNKLQTFQTYKYNKDATNAQAVIEIDTPRCLYQGFLTGEIKRIDKGEG